MIFQEGGSDPLTPSGSAHGYSDESIIFIFIACMFDLIFYVPVNNLSHILCWDGSSWVEPVLSKD